jgi:FkbM family methyltransferase
MSALKLLLRSRSLGFTRDKRSAARPTTLHTIPWGAGAIHYRPGTSDQEIIYQVLLKPGRKAKYWLPDEVRPKTILDIGGNIGVVSVYFAQRYPQARIFTVEPVPENFVVLAKNIAPYPNIKAYQIALGHRDGELTLRHSDNPINFGGFSVGAEGVHPTQSVQVRMQAVETFLSDLDVPMVDLIKIDTEGAEFDILTSVPERVLSQVRWIVGELHGRRDFELLAHLSRWFEIGLTKRIESRLFMFHARNKTNELSIQTA